MTPVGLLILVASIVAAAAYISVGQAVGRAQLPDAYRTRIAKWREQYPSLFPTDEATLVGQYAYLANIKAAVSVVYVEWIAFWPIKLWLRGRGPGAVALADPTRSAQRAREIADLERQLGIEP